MELKPRRRRKGEQLQEVFQDIKRLMALAYPGQVGPLAETMATDSFVDALDDRDLRKQVLQRTPATLAKALTWAIRIEAIDASGCIAPPAESERDNGRERDRNRCKEKAYVHVAASEATGAEAASAEELRQLRASLHEHQLEFAHWRALAMTPVVAPPQQLAEVSAPLPVSTVTPVLRTPVGVSQQFRWTTTNFIIQN